MPIFEGIDPYDWLYRVERYSAINDIYGEERLGAAAVCLEGTALAWFQWREQRDPINTWDEFKLAVSERFRAD